MPHPRAGSPGRADFADDVRLWVERSCAGQGLPVKVKDRELLAGVAILLRSPPPSRNKSKGRPKIGNRRYQTRHTGLIRPESN
jgi:hypothetical protein